MLRCPRGLEILVVVELFLFSFQMSKAHLKKRIPLVATKDVVREFLLKVAQKQAYGNTKITSRAIPKAHWIYDKSSHTAEQGGIGIGLCTILNIACMGLTLR